MNSSLNRRKQQGFSIIEALIAGLVLSFGTLALVGAQVALSRNSDVAKQRTEATRTAQQRMEQLRAYASATTQTGVQSYDSLAGGTVNSTVLNTQFETVTTVGAGTGLDRPVSVQVNWTDRGGAAQSVVLSSVISKTNLFKVGLIMQNVVPPALPGGSPPRDNNVPFPALDIGHGRSTYQWPASSLWYVFNNTDGDVVYRCTTQPNLNTNLDTACTAIRGYVVAGYVSTEPPPQRRDQETGSIDTQLSPWSITTCSITNRANIRADDAQTSYDDGAACFVQNVIVGNAVNPNCPYLSSANASTDAIVELRYFKCYAALVELDDPQVNRWGGRMTFAANPPGNAKLCRYPHNLVNSSGVYVDIAESLNNENYFAITSGNCTGGLLQHQPPP